MRENNHETSELVLLLLLAVTTLSCVDAASNDTEYVYRMHVALPRSEKDLLPQIWAVHCVGLAVSNRIKQYTPVMWDSTGLNA